MSNVKPILKWAGGKRKLAPLISSILKEECGKTTTYIEPFFGGGSVYFELYNKQLFEKAIINDIIPQLVSFYKTLSVSSCVQSFYDEVEILLNQFNSLDNKKDRQEFFYKIRTRFNELWIEELNKVQVNFELERNKAVESAVLLFVLNRTCFNGLFRVNKKGLFNVPLGSYKYVQVPLIEEVENYSKALSKAEIFFGDYEFILQKSIDIDNSFVYLDPPYVPNSKTSNFTSYSKDSFKDINGEDYEHFRLSQNFDQLVKEQTKVLLSNHNNQKAFDIFVSGKENIYAYEIEVTKTIGRTKGSKNSSNELLISSFKIPKLGKSIKNLVD